MVRIVKRSRRLPAPARRNGTSPQSTSPHGMAMRQGILLILTGVLIGYLILPIVLVHRVGFNDFLDERIVIGPKSASIPSEGWKDAKSTVHKDVMGEETANLRSPLRPPSPELDNTQHEFPDHDNSRIMASPPQKKKTPILSTSFATEFRGREKYVLSEMSTTEKNVLENHSFLSSYSIPSATTPYVMHTPRLPDRDRMKILVTGGAGFVGSHLVDKLMMEGHEVIVIDNFFTGQKTNVEHWMHHPNFSIQTHDVTEPIMMEVDQIYHLACPASPPHYQYNPVKTIKTSTMGTINMLGLAKRVKARMLLTSTSEIYGDPQVHPQPETYWGHVNTIGPRSCYDEGKRVAETMMYSYKHQNNIEVRVARIFNTFGPRMHPNDGRVVSNFIIQALQDKDITIYGPGLQTRSFQYVDDLVEGLHALMNSDYDLPVNLGNPDEYTVKNFAEYIKELTNSESEIKFLPKTEDDPNQRKPDITVAKEKLGWEPKVEVKDGLEKTISYFQRVLDDAGEIIPTGPTGEKPQA